MRVLHIVPAFFDFKYGLIGGGERYALELAKHMAEEVPTTLVSFGEEEHEEKIGKLRVHVIGNTCYIRGQRANPFSFALLDELRKADVIHCHQQHILASSFAALICRLTHRRVFVSDLGGGGWDISGYFSTDWWYHGHLHLSEYSKKIYGHSGKKWAHVIYGGVDTEKFSPDECVRKNGTVLFVGRILAHKGIDDLITAVPPDLSLEIIGHEFHGAYLQDLQNLAKGKRVTFRLDCKDDELIAAYRKSLCIVLPSVYKNRYGQETKVPELLGQTLLEGMACGLPTICTNVASLPEVVEDGVTGFVIPPNDPESLRQKLCWLRDHPEKAQAMGQVARRHVLERFTWPQVVRRCLKIYNS